MYKCKVYVLNYSELKNIVMKEIHNVPYVRHPRYQKTITIVRNQYFWLGKKKEVANYIARCPECQKVNNEHRHPIGMLHPLPIPKWKWEVVTMGFFRNIPRIVKQHDSIMVVLHKLTKTTHFILVKKMHKEKNIAKIYMKEVFRLHGVPKEIVLNRDPKFTSIFGKSFSRDLGQI